MQMKIYYLNKNFDWVSLDDDIENNITVIFPQNYTFGNDESLDCAEFSFYSNTDYFIPIDTIIKIVNNNHFSYWIVKDSKSSNLKYPSLYTKKMENINTLTLVEPLEILRGFKVEPYSFAENSYSLQKIINRDFKIAKFDGECIVPKIKYSNPKFTFVSSNLFLIIHELARTIDCSPYLYFNEATKKWSLRFQKLDELNRGTYDISVFNNPILLKTDTGEGIAKNVYCEVNNLKVDKTEIEPTNFGKFAKALNGSAEISANNLIINTNFKIDKLKKLVVYGWETHTYKTSKYIPIKIDYQHPLILENNIVLEIKSGALNARYYVKIITKNEYDNLTEDEKNNYPENITRYIYIYYENNIIYLENFAKIANSEELGNFYLNLQDFEDHTEYYGFIGDWKKNVDSNLSTVQFQISYKYTAENMTIPVLTSNESNYDDTTYFNQNTQQVDPDRIGRSLQTYIDNMSSGSLMVSGTFNIWNEIPMPGSLIKNGNKKYLVNSISIINNAYNVEATAQLTEFHSKRREYVQANGDLQLNSIPNENLIQRKSLKYLKLNFDILNNNLENNDTNLINYVLNNKIKNFVYGSYIEAGTYNYDLFLYPSFFRVSNNIIIHCNAENNIIWDKYTNNNYQVPQNYTNEKGFIDSMTVYLYKDITYSQAMSYPIFNDIDTSKQLILETGVDKDSYEIFDYTLQLNYRGKNGVIVREEYVENLLNPKEVESYTIKLFNIQIGKYDLIPSEEDESYVDKIENVSIAEYNPETSAINVEFATKNNVNYKSFVIMIDDDTPLFIKNFDEKQTSISSFNIYVSVEDGTPIRTGLYGINPKERGW